MIAKRVTPPNQLGLGLNLSTKKTRKREFLDGMDRVVPWGALVQIVEPYSPRAKTGRPPFAIETMLRIHYCMYGPDAFCKLSLMMRSSLHTCIRLAWWATDTRPQP